MDEGISNCNEEPLEFRLRSAKGAEYDSQGQALSGAKRVAPGYKESKDYKALKVRNYHRHLCRSFRASQTTMVVPGATCFAPLSTCPWLSYSAPSALVCQQ